jgi:hypothetical protein
MTQFDATATPMSASFAVSPVFDPLDPLEPSVDPMARNPPTGAGGRASLKRDLSDYDRADPDELNLILWAALEPGEPMPAPVRSLRLRSCEWGTATVPTTTTRWEMNTAASVRWVCNRRSTGESSAKGFD